MEVGKDEELTGKVRKKGELSSEKNTPLVRGIRLSIKMKKKCMQCGEEFETPRSVYTHCPKCRTEFDEHMKELFKRARRKV